MDRGAIGGSGQSDRPPVAAVGATRYRGQRGYRRWPSVAASLKPGTRHRGPGSRAATRSPRPRLGPCVSPNRDVHGPRMRPRCERADRRRRDRTTRRRLPHSARDPEPSRGHRLRFAATSRLQNTPLVLSLATVLSVGATPRHRHPTSSRKVEAGETYFVPPGHLPMFEQNTVMIEFSQDTTYTNEDFAKPS